MDGGIAKSKRLRAKERREVVMEAAGMLFGERGYERTRLDEVAAAAGVTKPILYRHFDSKQALYRALLERHRDDLARFRVAIPDEGSLHQRLHSLLEAWFEYVESHAYAWQMLFRDSGGGPEIQSFRADVHARAREVLVDVIRASSRVPIPRRELGPLAELMSMGMASLVLWWMESPGVSRAAAVDAMARAWTGLLTVRPDD